MADRTAPMDEPATPRTSNLVLRLLTAGVWGPFIIYMLWWGPAWLFPAVTGMIALGGAWELFSMIAPQHALVRGFGVLGSAAAFFMIGLGLGGQFLPLCVIGLTCLGMLVALARPEPLEGAAMRMGWAIAGPLYLG